jgi:Ni/Co efflux regulator RcnB
MRETKMKTMVLALALVAMAAASHAAQRTNGIQDDTLAKKCRQAVGNEEPEATDGKSHMGQLNVQRYSNCMMGAPH